MAAPWEKYQQQQPSNAAPAKPWERYASQEAPAASEQPVEPTGLAMERAPQREQPQSSAEQPSDSIRASDFGLEALEGGVSGTGYAVGGAGDFLSWGGDLVESGLRKLGLGDLIDKGDAALGGMAPSDAFQAFEGWMQKGSEQIDASQTEAFREVMKDSTPEGDVFKPSTWSMGEDPSVTGYAAQMAGLIGQFAPQAATMLAGSPQRVAVAMTLMGGTQAGGSQANEAEERVMGMDETQLSEASTLYRDLRDNGLSHDEAQQQTAKTAGAAAFLGGAPIGAAGGAVTSYVLGPMQKAIGGGIAGRTVDSVGLQAPAEALQEVSETMMARANTNRAIGGNQDISEGTFGDAVLGGMFGGGLGLAGAAGGGLDATPERTPNDAVRERTPEDIAAINERYDNREPPSQPTQEPEPTVDAAPEAEAAPEQAAGLDMDAQRRWEEAWREQAAQDGIPDYDPNANLPDTTITINGEQVADESLAPPETPDVARQDEQAEEVTQEVAQEVEHPAVAQPEPALAPDQPSPNPDAKTPRRVPVESIKVDPEAYQFRTEVNEQGVDTRLEGVKRWDDLRAGNLILHERTDGSVYAADGHHRINLARQLQQPDVNAIVLREADGVTVEDARRAAAEANIAAGSATSIDAAKVFRNSEGDIDTVIRESNLPRTQLVRDGADIAKLDTEPFGAVLNKVIAEKDGAVIGRSFSDPDQQLAAVGVFQRVKPTNDNQRELLANEVRQAGFAESQGEQGGLFGDDPAESLIGERVKVMDNLRQTLVRDKRLFATLNDNAQTAEQAGNRIAKDRNNALQETSADAIALLERATTTPEINQQINDAARRVKDGETLASVTRELKEALLNGSNSPATSEGRTPAPSSGQADQAGQDAGRSEPVPAVNDARTARAGEQRPRPGAGAQAEPAVTLKTDGKPFQTRKAVELSKRFRDTPNAQPVEVEGGWGFVAPDLNSVPGENAEASNPPSDERLYSTDELADQLADKLTSEKGLRSALVDDQALSMAVEAFFNTMQSTDFAMQLPAARSRKVNPELYRQQRESYQNLTVQKVVESIKARRNDDDAPLQGRVNDSENTTPLLEMQTEESLAQREQQVQQAEQAEANQRNQEAQRAQADRDAEDFVLSGSNRTADIAASRGQSDIFGAQPAQPPAEAPAVTSRASKPRKPPKLNPRQQRASEAFGGAVPGDMITMNRDAGYARTGNGYRVNAIGKDGSLDITNTESGSSTVISQGEWLGAYRNANATLAQVVSQPEPDSEAQSQDSAWGDTNTLVSRDRAEEIRARLRAKLGQLNSGIDPEMLSLGTELAAFHLEAGARRFTDFARTMARDLGTNVEQIRPYLRAWYNGGRDMMEDSGLDVTGMDDPGAVREALNTLTNEGDADVSSTGQRTEPDTGVSAAENDVGREAVRDGSGRAQRSDGEPSPGAGSERRSRPGRPGVSEDSAGTGRTRSDNRVHRGDGEYDVAREPTGRDDSGRSRDGDDGGAPTDARASRTVTRHAQKTVDAVSKAAPAAIAQDDVVPASLDSIAETLPQLLKVQQEDVAFAERRFFEANGRGVLFANGTGTGKTYSGLGVAKRHALMGRPNILIVVPSDKIARDWMAAGENVDLSIKQLRDTRDNGGEGSVITTYANMRQNNSLAEREWDLIIADEAHNLLQRDEFQETGALSTLRALTGYPGSARRLAEMQRPDLVERLETLRSQAEAARVQSLDSGRGEDANRETRLSEERKQVADELDQLAKDIEQTQASKWEARGTRTAFLSATPFAYRKSVEWANGYLFDYDEGQTRTDGTPSYNQGDARERFFMQNFGYRMRYNKLNTPGPEVDVAPLEREFNEKLKKDGAMRARMLEVDQDYDRRFQLVADGIGTRIDEGLEWIQERARAAREQGREGDEQAQAEASVWDELSERISKRFNYLNRAYLLESIKAKHAVPYIQQHLKQGRKVVVFHDYNKGGGFHPFRPMAGEGDSNIFKRLEAERPDLYNLDLTGLQSPRDALNKAFGERMVEFNGTVSKGERAKNVERFNRDNSGIDIIAVQTDAGSAGISLHDTSGKHQRVLINLGLPVKPTAQIQTEGRIYRVGVQSNAIQRLMSTGLSMERSMVASKLAERAGTAENLAMGNLARALKDNIIEAYQDADNYPAGMEGEGVGGKELDRTAAEMTDFDRARSFYYGQQKRNARNKSREGKDYFATPEPVGLKMVEWAGIRAGDDVLEPSAGHGAIARWIPETAQTHLVEPSYELASRLRLAAGDAKVYETTFEDLAKSNKYDSIVMNPPFGLGGSTAIAHLDRAFKTHLRQGGRVVALIPTGPAADKRFDKWFEETEGVSMVADIKLPTSTFERAATKVATRIVILDKRADNEAGAPSRLIDLSNADSINDLFDRIEGVDIGRNRPEPPTVAQVDTAAANLSGQGASFETAQTTHAKKGIELFVAKMNGRVERNAFNALRDIAKANGGYWSSYKRDGAIPGFQFESEAQRQAFIEAASENANDQRYSVTPQSDRPEAPPTAEDVVTALESMSEQLGDFEVVENTTQLPPMSLLKMALNGVNPLDVRGFYEGNRLYIIAENNDSVGEAVRTAIHEAVGHKGIRGVLGAELEPVMRQLYRRLPHSRIGREARDEVLRDYPFLDTSNPDHHVTIAEEMVAHLIENGHRPAAWQRAVAKMKELLRHLLPAIPWTTTDVLELGERSRDYLRRQQAEADDGQADNMTFAMRRRTDTSRVSDEFSDLDADQAEALDMIGPLGVTGSAMAKVRDIGDRAAVKMRAGLVDKYAALKELDEKALGRDFIESSTASSSWILARMAPAAQGALHTLIHSGRIRLDPEQKVIELQEGEKNSLHEVLAQLGDAAEVSRFMGWIAGNRAEKLREQGRENYFEERHIRGLMELNNGRAKNGEARRTLYPRVFEQFQAIRDDVLSIAEQSGLLRKAMSEPEAALVIARQYGAPEALVNKLKRADVSMRNDADGDMLDNAQAIYAQARQELEQWLDTYVNDTLQPDALNTPDQQYNNIMQEWESLTRDQREIWAEEFYVPFYRVLDENTHDVQGPASTAGLTRQRAYQRLKGADMRIGDLLENTLMNYHHLLSASLKNQAATQAIENAVAVGIAGEVAESNRDPKSSTFILRDGKQVFYEISDDLVYKALVNMTDAGMKAVMDSSGLKAMRWFKRLLTNMVTVTPEFVAANTIRDSLQSAAVTPAGMNPLWNAVRGAGYYANKRNRAQMIASGGSFNFGHLYGDRSDELKAQLNRNLRRAKVINDPGAALQAGKFLWRRWNEATEFAENVNRAKVYQANLDKGKLYAAFQARDLMDFSNHGSWFMTRFLIDTVPFLNARIQGLDKLYRDGFKPTLLTAFGKGSDSDKVRAKRFSIVTGALMVASIGLLMHNNDDEEYQALPEWQKDTYWYIRNGDDVYFIPKPFEVGAISTMAERVTQQFIDDTAGGDLFKERLWHMISQTFSFSPVPQAAAPLLDIYANRDPFRDRPIEPYWDQQLSPSLRFRSSTTMPARWLSGSLENVIGNDSMLALSPLQIDYLVNGYLGSVGGYAAGMSDTFWRRANGQQAPSSRWTESRPIRRFYRDLETPAYSTRYMDVFYQGLQEADRVYSDLRKMEEMGAIEEARELAQNKGDLLRLRKQLQDARGDLSDINKRMDQVRQSAEMDPDYKRRELERLRTVRNRIVEVLGREVEQQRLANDA
ncbi:LPD38 domain-containing protein [Halomonas sp. Cn5-12]|uniref:LPD38 domain-containing protein n=1 Tax=Halomonas sp. Cn5-12 TaxID=2908885 RepID=UPI001F3FA7E8|nr:LPD38 domain-containing protein [Halomonas sp. Cn5-12]MCF2911925.1 DEAD/DEAH box helicase family protein [Halomonas sp. Cn5-12]